MVPPQKPLSYECDSCCVLQDVLVDEATTDHDIFRSIATGHLKSFVPGLINRTTYSSTNGRLITGVHSTENLAAAPVKRS